MSFVARRRRASAAMSAVPLRRQDTGIYHEHQGEMYVANEYNAIIRKREEQQRKVSKMMVPLKPPSSSFLVTLAWAIGPPPP